METIVRSLSEWLGSELANLPPRITALYLEYGESVSPDQSLSVYADAFGFEHLSGGAFDPANPTHVAELGDFVWQARRPPHFPAAHYPVVDWLSALEAAVRSPDIQRVVESRGLRVVVGEHDGEVRVVR